MSLACFLHAFFPLFPVALWLDSNRIEGTIPTEIGLLTDLASVSMSNCTLAGTIPTEIGNLKDLRRLWLFDNNLTGQIPTQLSGLPLEIFEGHKNKLTGNMPQGLCSVIGKSDYKYKALTSDCNGEVTCDDSCCTTCY